MVNGWSDLGKKLIWQVDIGFGPLRYRSLAKLLALIFFFNGRSFKYLAYYKTQHMMDQPIARRKIDTASKTRFSFFGEIQLRKPTNPHAHAKKIK